MTWGGSAPAPAARNRKSGTPRVPSAGTTTGRLQWQDSAGTAEDQSLPCLASERGIGRQFRAVRERKVAEVERREARACA